METCTYTQQAIDFLNQTNTTFKAEFLEHGKHFENDTENRDIYKITLTRGSREYKFNFGQSLANSGFYAMYGKTKIDLPRGMYGGKDIVIKQHIRRTTRYRDFGATKNDKIIRYNEPTAYDVLACLTDYNPGLFEDFCSDFGYDTDSKTAEKTYQAVLNEWLNVCALFGEEELELLREIN